HHPCAGLAAQQLVDVFVAHHRTERAAVQRDRRTYGVDLAPERPEVGTLQDALGVVVPPPSCRVVAPGPTATVDLVRVVQHAPPQRRLAARGVVLDGATEDVVEAVERLGTGNERGDGRRL